MKELTDVEVGLSDLDCLILRPSMLVDRPGTGRVSLGPAQPHDEIAREDVAATLAGLLHEPRIRWQLLERNGGGGADRRRCAIERPMTRRSDVLRPRPQPLHDTPGTREAT
ncbi:NAD(P)H-binding protein [Geodermatophilus amargosae]|uniref:NAD(P)H-binding protein n=1 Tax=Geodermatophilus amargosae TaxID=1296565 RepID=UPI0034DEA166